MGKLNYDNPYEEVERLQQELADLKKKYESALIKWAEDVEKHDALNKKVGELEKKYRKKANKELSFCHSDLAVVILDELKQATEVET